MFVERAQSQMAEKMNSGSCEIDDGHKRIAKVLNFIPSSASIIMIIKCVVSFYGVDDDDELGRREKKHQNISFYFFHYAISEFIDPNHFFA